MLACCAMVNTRWSMNPVDGREWSRGCGAKYSWSRKGVNEPVQKTRDSWLAWPAPDNNAFILEFTVSHSCGRLNRDAGVESQSGAGQL